MDFKKPFLDNDFLTIKKIEIEEFEDFDPLEIVIRDVERFNNFTIQIVRFLLDNYEFPKDSVYINLLLERYNRNRNRNRNRNGNGNINGNNVEKRILEMLLEISELEIKTIALARVKNVLDFITEWYIENELVDTRLLNLLDKMERVSEQICGIPLKGDVIVIETDKGLVWGNRNNLKVDIFYEQDLQYSMTHDGDMNSEKPIYRLNIGGRIFFVNEIQKSILMNKRTITFSSYLGRNVLAVRWGESPESVDLYTFIPRDNCKLYI
jgi:hypothetical protein